MGVSTGGVLLIAGGGILAYAGFTGQNPLEAMKAIASGHPMGVINRGSDEIVALAGSVGSNLGAIANDALNSLPGLPGALMRHRDEKYSQTRRWQEGYSDCSSFIGKGLKDIGIKPPGHSVTSSYLASRDWSKISSEYAAPGDLVCNPTHIVCYLGNGQAIGQQNTRRNVQIGPVQDLMSGTGSYMYLRYNVESGAAGGSISSSKPSSGGKSVNA